VKQIKTHLNQAKPLLPQVIALADAAGLAAEEWSGRALLVNPPALNFVAVALLAELHGRMGYFPTCLRLRPVEAAPHPGMRWPNCWICRISVTQPGAGGVEKDDETRQNSPASAKWLHWLMIN